ncbi:MAG: site-specific integrase, partial [Muribaculaceae bacterium]|nr:site-specific integrase [Muribaculaceae bacterium]
MQTHDIDRNGDIKDVFVTQACMTTIVDYATRLNDVDTSRWSALEVKRYLESDRSDITFTAFAEAYIRRMVNLNQDNNAKIYTSALKSLQHYLGMTDIRFADLTRANLDGWITSLHHTRRARSLYPTCMRTVYRKALAQSHDPASRLPRKLYDTWLDIEIPWSEVPKKKAIAATECRKFFDFEIDLNEPRSARAKMGRDMALISFCLAGMNTVDIFKLRKKDYKAGVIGYYRSKTSGRRKDGAYFEIEVPPMIRPLIEQYAARDESPYLFYFADRYTDAKTFNTTVNQGIRQLCKAMGMADEDCYSFYSFRHTWATIAQNNCRATIDEVGFAMNHSTHRVTRGYIVIDFKPAWELNRKVIDFVFKHAEDNASTSTGSAPITMSEPAAVLSLSKSDMVQARAY